MAVAGEWVLAVPHYLVIGLFLGGGTIVALHIGGGLIGILVLIAAVILAPAGTLTITAPDQPGN